MANKDEKLSTCMITQAWLSNHWDSEKWNDDDINNANLSLVTQKIVEYLSEAGAEVVACYGITHDRDTREVWHYVVKSYVLEPKFSHGHWVVKFKNRESGLSLANIAVAVGLAGFVALAVVAFADIVGLFAVALLVLLAGICLLCCLLRRMLSVGLLLPPKRRQQ